MRVVALCVKRYGLVEVPPLVIGPLDEDGLSVALPSVSVNNCDNRTHHHRRKHDKQMPCEGVCMGGGDAVRVKAWLRGRGGTESKMGKEHDDALLFSLAKTRFKPPFLPWLDLYRGGKPLRHREKRRKEAK